ncbi:MAG TPA: outer membrane beta-barrel family protein [Chitinophagaceae bacterium]|nr:outer membrane beta-barrel family protein [Chitinophagaceae bacterium]
MLRHIFCLQALLLFLMLSCSGQITNYTIKGKIADSLSKIGLENTTISINKQNAIAREVVSGKNGEFNVLLPPGEYQLTITHIGYKKLEKTITAENNNIQLPVYFLQTDFSKLKTVTVETKKPFITLSAGKINLNIAESAVAAGNTAWDVLQIAPGVIASDDGSLTLNGKAVTVYMDGRPTYLSGEQLKNMLSTMHVSAINKMELISNPSARYDAAGQAIINIKTKKISKKGYNGTYTSGIGASRFLKYNAGIDMNHFKNKINLFGSYDFSHNGNNYLPISQRTSRSGSNLFYITESEDDTRRRNNHNYKAGLDYSPSKNTTIGILFRSFSNHRGREVSGLTILGSQKNIPDSSIHAATTGSAVFTSPALNFFFKTSFDSSKKELVINADYYRYNQQWNDNFLIEFKNNNGSAYKSAESRRDNSPTILDIYAVTADYTQHLKKLKLETGIKTSIIKTDNDVRWENNFGSGWVNDSLRTNHFIYKENINAGYAGISGTSKKWVWEAMLRAEQTNTEGHSVTLNSKFTRHYLDLFPSISLVNKLSKKNELTISYRKSIRRPFYSYTNPFLIYQGQYNYFQGNPDMKPGYSHSVQLIHSYNNLLFTTLSYTYEKNSIGIFYKQNDSTKTIIRYYDNYSKDQVISFTVAFSKNLNPWWMTSTNLSLMYEIPAYGEIKPKKVTGRPTINSLNNFTLNKAGVKIEISGFCFLPYTDGFYNYKTLGYLNLGLQKDILKKKASLRLNIRDVFKTNAFAYTALYGNVDIFTKSASDSRSIQLNFNYRFGKQFANKNKNRKSAIESETNRIN